MARLTPKQKRFVEEYLIDLNATQAAIRAGYKNYDSVGVDANKTLKNPKIEKVIAEAMAERSKRTGVNADRVVQELAKIAFCNISDCVDMNTVTVKDNASRDDLAAISSVRVKTFPTRSGELGVEREIRMHDKIRALELLGKHMGMFTDKFKIEGAIPVVIHDDLGDESDDESDE